MKKICVICSKEFEGRKNSSTCSEVCRSSYKSWWQRKKKGGPEVERKCVVCHNAFKTIHRTKKCCSRACSAQRERDVVKAWIARHRDTSFTCVECGKVFKRDSNRITCSEACRALALPKRRHEVIINSSRKRYWRPDVRAKIFSPEGRAIRNAINRRYCKTPKGRAAAFKKRVKRAGLLAAVRVELIDYEAIDARTEGLCALCWTPVDKTIKHPDGRSASYDHIIPVAKGGEHTMANIQLTHLRCNCAKRDKIENLF